MNTQHALVILGNPGPDANGGPRQHRAQFLLTAASKLSSSAAVEELAPGVWLLPLADELPAFCALLQLAEHWDIPVKTLILDARPDFLTS